MSSWWQRWRARFRLRHSIGLWYHAGYHPPSLERTGRVLDIEVKRAEQILESLADEKLVGARDVRRPVPADLELLSRVHTYSYLEEVTSAERLGRIFGLEPHDVEVDSMLASQRLAVGGTVAAAEWAAGHPSRIGFNLGGGFHHAEPETGGGFCVYNDVAAAIARLRAGGFADSIAIIDLDFHQGNGSLATFRDDPTVFTFSIHGAVWSHSIDAVADEEITLPEGTGDAEYLDVLERTLPGILERHDPRLMFYVAGNDVLAGDELGAFVLTRRGVFERDRFVVELARKRRCPLVVTLAGGYGPMAWQASATLIRWMLTDELRLVELTRQDEIRLGFRRIAWSLDPLALQRESGIGDLTLDDLMVDLGNSWRRETRLLGYYSVQGVELALEQFGILAALRRKGFSDLKVRIDPSDRNRQRVNVEGRKGDGPFHPLIDIIVRREAQPAPPGMESRKDLDLLSIEWLLLQDPTDSFSFRRPRLPGQDHPGLGMVREVMELLYQASRRLGLDGIVAHPSRFHVAAVGAAHLFFLEPRIQGEFDALRERFAGLDLASVSHLLEHGRARDSDGRAIEWNPTDIIAPVSERMREWFESEHYRAERRAARKAMLDRGFQLESEASTLP